ncbi:MAG: hypothetical protein AB7R90_01630 [Reyranellaceae bacterium]
MSRLYALVVLAVLALVAPAQAQHSLPEGFFGTFSGLGLSETMDDGKVVEVKPRDFDVTIAKAADGGFTVTWKTTEYTIKPRRSRLDAADESVTFAKSERPGMYWEKKEVDIASGDPLYWARVSHSTLDVYRLVLNDEGRHELSVWQRTLDGDQMNLIFQRSGETSKPRVVKGTLTRLKQ